MSASNTARCHRYSAEKIASSFTAVNTPRAYRLADKRRVLRRDKPQTRFVLVVCGTESARGASWKNKRYASDARSTNRRNLVVVVVITKFIAMPRFIDAYIEYFVGFFESILSRPFIGIERINQLLETGTYGNPGITNAFMSAVHLTLQSIRLANQKKEFYWLTN